jgi:hypothetical protein
METWVFTEVLSVKAIPSCGGDLHLYSRVTGFDNIIDFEFRITNQFYF